MLQGEKLAPSYHRTPPYVSIMYGYGDKETLRPDAPAKPQSANELSHIYKHDCRPVNNIADPKPTQPNSNMPKAQSIPGVRNGISLHRTLHKSARWALGVLTAARPAATALGTARGAVKHTS